MKNSTPDDFPPFLQTWSQVFILVLGCLGGFIWFLYWFSTWYQ